MAGWRDSNHHHRGGHVTVTLSIIVANGNHHHCGQCCHNVIAVAPTISAVAVAAGWSKSNHHRRGHHRRHIIAGCRRRHGWSAQWQPSLPWLSLLSRHCCAIHRCCHHDNHRCHGRRRAIMASIAVAVEAIASLLRCPSLLPSRRLSPPLPRNLAFHCRCCCRHHVAVALSIVAVAS